MNNVFWNFAAHNQDLPEAFEFTQWQEAWDHSIKVMTKNLKAFKRRPTWEAYYLVGQSNAVCGVLREIIVHIPLFLGQCPENLRQDAERSSIKQMEQLLMSFKDVMQEFLYQEQNGERASEARREHSYWNNISPHRADCLQVEHEMQHDHKPLFISRLSDLQYYPSMRKKYRQKAEEFGLKGYVIDARDHDINFVMSFQDDERVREGLWKAIQEQSPTQSQVDVALQVRQNWAYDGGAATYAQHLNHRSKGLSVSTVANVLKQHTAALSHTHQQLSEQILQQGMLKSGWYGNNEQQNLPWNKAYLYGEAEECGYDLLGGEFPLRRVLHHIIPDLLSVGGWTLERDVQKIGTGKRSLYAYHVVSEQREHASVLFAPYPHPYVKDSDNYQAYAAVLREKWSVDGAGQSPVVLVAQNLAIKNGCLENLEQLRFLSHEFGHVLHFLSFEGTTFDEYMRMPNYVTELPSLLLEQLSSQPETLRRWCSRKAKGSTKKISYWQRRSKAWDFSLIEHMRNMEASWLDIKAHDGSTSSLRQLQTRFRKDTGLPALHRDDRSIYHTFDFTEHAGYSNTYIVGEAISKALIGPMNDDNIRSSMKVLLENVLSKPSHPHIDHMWKSVYGESLHHMFCRGMDTISSAHQQRAKKAIRKSKTKQKKG